MVPISQLNISLDIIMMLLNHYVIRNLLNIKSDNEPVYCHDSKYIKKKNETYGDKVNTNFQK